MKKVNLNKKELKHKSDILQILYTALLTTLCICLFISIFWSPRGEKHNFSAPYHYFINRGFPKAWAGTSDASKTTPFSIIKMPFLKKEISNNVEVTKVIDLGVFLPLFTTIFIFIFGFYYIANLYMIKFIYYLYHIHNIQIFLACIIILLYFFWFARY